MYCIERCFFFLFCFVCFVLFCFVLFFSETFAFTPLPTVSANDKSQQSWKPHPFLNFQRKWISFTFCSWHLHRYHNNVPIYWQQIIKAYEYFDSKYPMQSYVKRWKYPDYLVSINQGALYRKGKQVVNKLQHHFPTS